MVGSQTSLKKLDAVTNTLAYFPALSVAKIKKVLQNVNFLAMSNETEHDLTLKVYNGQQGLLRE
jgi:hypothetical protein